MSIDRYTLRRHGRRALAFGATTLLAIAAAAQVAGMNEPSYREQLAACASGDSYQDRATCTREVRAAEAARRHGQLAGGDNFSANALARCDAYREREDMQACRARIMDPSQVSGSVAQGGLLRQYEYQVPAETAAAAPMPEGGAMPPAGSATMGAGAMPMPQGPLNPMHPAARTAQEADRMARQPAAEMPVFPMYPK